MRSRSLRFKLGWNHGLIISLVFVMIGMMRYATVSYRAQTSFDKDLNSDARALLTYLHFHPDGIEWKTGNPLEDTLLLESLRPFFVVTDASGRIFHREGLSEPIRRVLEDPAVQKILGMTSGYGDAQTVDGRRLRFVNLPVPAEPPVPPLFLHLGRSTEPLDVVLEEYFFIWISSAPVVLVASVVLGWFLAGRALRPFEEVSRTAMQITSRNLNTQIVTERKEEEIQRLVQAFNAMVSRLDRSFQQMRRFNADVAHELRTPLAILQGENEVALRGGGLPEETYTLLESNLEELERLSRLVNDLLTLAEAEAGTRILVRKPVNLRPVLQDLVEQMQVLALEREIQIETGELPDAQVEVDEHWMRRAFLNLLDNAIKYSQPGGKIRVRGEVSSASFFVEIRDEGSGISGEDLPFIFDRLFRADSARSSQVSGRGLGLTLAKWIIESHEGSIHVESDPGRGSLFRVSLPCTAGIRPPEGSVLEA